MFVDDGRDEIANWIGNVSATAPTHIALGGNSDAPTINDATLGSELERFAITTRSVSTRSIKLDSNLNSLQGVGDDYTEVGVLNAGSNGDLFSRNTFNTISKTSSFELQVSITFRVR